VSQFVVFESWRRQNFVIFARLLTVLKFASQIFLFRKIFSSQSLLIFGFVLILHQKTFYIQTNLICKNYSLHSAYYFLLPVQFFPRLIKNYGHKFWIFALLKVTPWVQLLVSFVIYIACSHLFILYNAWYYSFNLLCIVS